MKAWKNIAIRLSCAGVLALIVVISAGCSRTQMASRNYDPIASGRLTYESYCMNCHGTEARGDGPVADLLTISPSDLTKLSQKNNGVFPASSVYDQIDGRDDVRSHGTREMPVWGNIWRENNGVPRSEEEAQRMINELVEYLRSVQDSTAAM